MIDRDHTLPICKQATLLDISRGAVYYQPKPLSSRDKMLMNRIDRLHLELPFAGARMLRDLLRQAGLDRYFRFYNTRRPHSSLDRQTPDQFYFESLPLPMAA